MDSGVGEAAGVNVGVGSGVGDGVSVTIGDDELGSGVLVGWAVSPSATAYSGTVKVSTTAMHHIHIGEILGFIMPFQFVVPRSSL